ncbi:MAG: hypothetical protein IH986_17015 [Planctomycetes bacterium]|nr:hypothetical protein [Planctomycetota bacterium]
MAAVLGVAALAAVAGAVQPPAPGQPIQIDLALARLAPGEYLVELDTARRRASMAGRPVDVAETLDNWESLDMDGRRSFLVGHVNRIVVKDEAVEVAV